MQTPLLDRVHRPADLRQLDKTDLRQLADELRAEMVAAVAETGGHLAPAMSSSLPWPCIMCLKPLMTV